MKNIDHIVYIMLENRSLDNVLGWLYDSKANPPTLPNANLPSQQPPTYEGLHEKTYYNNDKNGKRHWVTKGTSGKMDVPENDPNESYCYVNNQLFEVGSDPCTNPAPKKPAGMMGFYKDFYSFWDTNPSEIMQSYTPAELPVLNGLAKSFAVSDAYFCSIPSQTNCNRAFSLTGNSLGNNDKGELWAWVDNHFGTLDPFELEVTFNQRTIWNVMNENGLGTPDDWMIYYQYIWSGGYCYTRDLLDQINVKTFDAHFATYDKFKSKARDGKLPKFSYLEPDWGLEWHGVGQNGNDYHPPCNLVPGEQFLNEVYTDLTFNTAAWQKTLLIINFDEHGGTYDHVGPKWTAISPWAHPGDGGDGTPDPKKNLEHKFDFSRFGVRVPLILVSPYVPAGLVFRTGNEDGPYEHCSVIATILEHFGIAREKWKLGSRVARAASFGQVLSLPTPRTDKPKFKPPAYSGREKTLDPAYGELQKGIAIRVLKDAIGKGADGEAVKAAYERHFGDEVKTVSQLQKALRRVLEEACGQSVEPESPGKDGREDGLGGGLTGVLRRFFRRLLRVLGMK